jgi:hypothetical protein
MSRRRNPQRLVANHDFPRLPIEFEKHGSLARQDVARRP